MYEYMLKYLPKIELPYEYITHKEAHGDLYTAIPLSRKYLIWFTYNNYGNICLLLELHTKTKRITKIERMVSSFNSNLSFGTIFYGSLVKGDVNNFIIEDILYYNGDKIDGINFINKLVLFNHLFKEDINSNIYVKNQLVFKLPVMHTNKNEFYKLVSNVSYNIYCIQIRNLYGETVNVNYINKNKKVIFFVKAQVRSDIYELYYKNGNEVEFYNYAFIDSYKTSVFMNNIFRNIKENKDLDKIEESDSEDEFENISLDKYLKNKSCHILCEYNYKFSKWIPVKLMDESSTIVSKNELSRI